MREIRIDDDTVIGFDYENNYYFITNKDTTTQRTTPENALDVLKIVAPDTTLTTDDLISLATDTEYVSELFYTWEDTGAYIKTIQLNDYIKYPLTLDCEKNKLYIMNSPVIFDLTLNEGRRVRLEQIQAFYRDTLGLYVPLQDLQTLYNLLVSYYLPACYNEITVLEAETEGSTGYALKYNNTLKVSDYHGDSPAVYSCTLNPNKNYSSYNYLADISNITGNTITLTTTVAKIVQEGTLINVSNTETQIDTTTYSADGMYTVASTGTNTISTTENLASNFSIIPTTVNLIAYKNFITSISRDNNTITLTNSANNFLVGDTIVVNNAKITTEYETLSLDGFYTIIGIEGNVLTVDETPITNYSTTNTAYVFKPIPQLTVTSIEDNMITVSEDTFPSTIQANTPIAVITTISAGDINARTIQYATITTLYQGDRQLKVNTNLIDNAPQYGTLNEPIEAPTVLIEVSESENEVILPNGTFMVDNTEQAISYISLLEGLIPPSNEELDENINNIGNFNSCNTQVRNYYIINKVSENINRMTCKGIYSKVYSEEQIN